jgi:hypothetical protein
MLICLLFLTGKIQDHTNRKYTNFHGEFTVETDILVANLFEEFVKGLTLAGIYFNDSPY